MSDPQLFWFGELAGRPGVTHAPASFTLMYHVPEERLRTPASVRASFTLKYFHPSTTSVKNIFALDPKSQGFREIVIYLVAARFRGDSAVVMRGSAERASPFVLHLRLSWIV